MFASGAHAQLVVPGAAEGSRIRPEGRLPVPTEVSPRLSVERPKGEVPVIAPAGAEDVRFVLRGVTLKGNTAFSTATLEAMYRRYLGKEVSLKQVYEIAARITHKYRNADYFLSYAYIPNQEIGDGVVTIALAEGYISRVRTEGKDANARITRQYADRLTAERPSRSRTVESTLLRLNDLPGSRYRAVLTHDAHAAPGETTLSLIPSAKEAQARIGFDNGGSRYLGPNEVNVVYSDSFLPLQQTTVVGLTSVPMDELNYGMVGHSVVVAPDFTVDGNLAYTKSSPGYTLKPFGIDSSALTAGVGVGYQAIRQRDENLLLKMRAESTQVKSDLLSSVPLTRDDIRVVRASAFWGNVDAWNGSNNVNMTISQGINAFGASQPSDINKSRAEAIPNFTKAELSLSRLQGLGGNFALWSQASGQWSDDPLYASEEFGVGGQTYGRAYNTSEIVGDRGVDAMMELRYVGWRTWQPVNIEPFMFYDIGLVTNLDNAGQEKRESLSSAGMGMRFATIWGQSGSVGLAWPLTRSATAPIYGQGPNSPRILLQFSHDF